MYKHRIPLLPQEELGYHFGLVVPVAFKRLFWNPRMGRKPKSGYGTQIGIGQKAFEPSTIFKKLRIPLRMVLHSGKEFTKENLLRVLKEGEKKNKDLLVCFDWAILKGMGKNKGGHVCVFDRIDPKTKKIRLVDPSQNQAKWHSVSVERLYQAMAHHSDKGGGVWELARVQ
jgi:hypothetical protein